MSASRRDEAGSQPDGLATAGPRRAWPDELVAGVQVRHALGDGEVLGVEPDVVTVVFDDVGYKQQDRALVAAAVLEVITPNP